MSEFDFERRRRYVKSDTQVTVPAPRAVKRGDGVLVGKIFGVAQNDAALGAPVNVLLRGEVRLQKLITTEDPVVAGAEFDVGDDVYWDSVNHVVTDDEEGLLVGTATQEVDDDATHVKLVLLGRAFSSIEDLVARVEALEAAAAG